MLRVALVNMPFAGLTRPSIALTQLKAVVDGAHDDQVETKIFHLNHDFVTLFGLDIYDEICNSPAILNSGLGDWIFRQAAFPELPDNERAYFSRYFPRNDERTRRFREIVADARARLGQFFEELIDANGLDRYDVVGFTSMFAQTVPSLALARHIKARNPQAITAMGGANCEAPMGQELVIGAQHLDYVFSGPALISLPRVVEHLLRGERHRVTEVAGVFDRETALAQRGKSIIGEELDIDEVIDLDYDDYVELVQTRYPNWKAPVVLTFETSRGCWWGERAHCTFCGLNGMTMAYRSMAPEKARALISGLFRYAHVATRLECVDNIMPKNYPAEVFAGLDTPKHMHFFYEVKADLSESDLRTLAAAKVTVLQPGIEALATSTLKLMKKGTTSFNNIAFLMHCLRHGIYLAWNLLIGFPGEPEEVYEKYVRDLPKLVHLQPPSGVFPVRFDRYSPYFKEAERYGLQLHPLAFYELTYPFPQESLSRMAYYFGDRNFRADYVKGVVKFIGPLTAIVDEWRRRWESERPALKLSQRGTQTIVQDSRFGELREYSLSDCAADIHDAVTRRRTQAEIARALPLYAEAEIAAGLQELQARSLLFQESGMFMGLGMPTAAAAQSLAREREAA
jgi:ribosomal peptide maturation radical SAM protein 1